MTDAPTNSSTPTVAVAFGGGGARGLAHIHVIEALDELGIRPVAIAGSSIGAIMGAAMAAGLTGEAIRDHTLATVGKPGEVMNRIWSLRPTTMRDVMNGFRFGQYNLERILRAFLPGEIPEDFSALTIPTTICVTDYYGQKEVVLSEGDLFQALAASAAIPAVFMPVTINGRVMIDGGITNPVPFDYLMDKADIVIGVDVVGGPEGEAGQIPARIDSLFGASQLMMQAIIALKISQQKPHIFLRPAVGRFHVLDFMKAGEVLESSRALKDEVKFAIDREIERRLIS
ncbi:patatin-like phospholipase family protein [Rhizobium sp. PAMB 3182]